MERFDRNTAPLDSDKAHDLARSNGRMVRAWTRNNHFGRTANESLLEMMLLALSGSYFRHFRYLQFAFNIEKIIRSLDEMSRKKMGSDTQLVYFARSIQ